VARCRGSLDRGMRIVAGRNWRWLGCRPDHLDWRHADTHHDPIPVALARDPAGTAICSSPPFNAYAINDTIVVVVPLEQLAQLEQSAVDGAKLSACSLCAGNSLA
jgi:hypothetical protein